MFLILFSSFILGILAYCDSSNTTTFVSIVVYLFFNASDDLITDNSTFLC